MFFFLAVSAFVVMICSPAFGWRNFRPPVLPERIRMQSQCLWLAPWSCSNKTEEPTNPIYFIWGSTNSMQHIIIIKYLEKIRKWLSHSCNLPSPFKAAMRGSNPAAQRRLQAVPKSREYSNTHKAPLPAFCVLVLNRGGLWISTFFSLIDDPL